MGRRSIDVMRNAFDAAFYLREYPDVGAAGVDPFEHFLRSGWRERRDPAPWFRTAGYLEVNPDVERAGVNPFEHYLMTGKLEGRPLKQSHGFRYDVLKNAIPLEESVRSAREGTSHPGPSPVGDLIEVLDAAGPLDRLHVSISHDDYSAALGGVQQCVARETAAMIGEGRPCLHLYPPVSLPTIDFESPSPRIGVLLNGRRVGVFEASALGPTLADRCVATSFAVHSFLGHDVPAITAVLRAMSARSGFFWLHDFSSLCANYALLRNDVAFCGAPPPDSQACEICRYGERRRIHLAEHAAFFRAFDLTVVAPSQGTLSLWLKAHPRAARTTRVLPHAALRPRSAVGSGSGGPLRVAFPGMPVTHKGWPVFAELADRFVKDRRYTFHHLGAAPDPRTPAIYHPVGGGASMASVIEELSIDVAVIWSLCPESFCFTAYEAVAAGAAVVTSPDAGNVPSFVAADERRGLIVDDEAALQELFVSGEILRLGRARRRPELYDLDYSRMTADLLDAEER